MKKVISILLAVMLIATLMVGCGKKTENDSNGTVVTPTKVAETDKSSEKEEVKEEVKEEKVEDQVLTVTTWDNTASPQFTATIEAFEAANKNVKVEVIDTAATEYMNKLSVQLAAERSDPDIIWVKDMGYLLAMVEKNQALPLDEYIKNDSFDLSAYNGAAEQLQVEGVNYSLPYRNDWYVLYYNKDLFDQAGVAYPSNDMTWDEYEELSKLVTSGEGPNKVFGTHNHVWQGLVTNWAVQDGEHTVYEKDYTYLKPWYEQAVRMQAEGLIQDYATLKTANIHYSSVFKNQQAAMMPMGTWFIATMIKSQADGETDFNWGIATIPYPSNMKAGATVGSITPIAISAATDVPDLAWEFVKFSASKENAANLANHGIFTGIQTDESLANIAAAEHFPEGESNIEALKYNHYVFDRALDPNGAEVRVVLDEVHEMIMIGEYSIDEGIKELTERVAVIKGW